MHCVPNEKSYSIHYVPRFSVLESLKQDGGKYKERKFSIWNENQTKPNQKPKYVCVIDTTLTFIQMTPKTLVGITEPPI